MIQKLAQVAEDEAETELDFVEAQRAIQVLQDQADELRRKAHQALEKKRLLQQRRLRLRKDANLLSERERKMFARELASIEEMEKLEAEAAERTSASASASAPEGLPTGSFGPSVPDVLDPNPLLSGFALSPVPSEFLGMEIPADWSFSQLLDTEDTA